MSDQYNNPYDAGRSGGAQRSGAEHGEWWRGYQDHLRGLQQPTAGAPAGSASDAARPIDVFDGFTPTGSSRGFAAPDGSRRDISPLLGAGCLLPILAPLLPVLVPLGAVAWLCLYPLPAAAAAGTWLAAARLAAELLPQEVLAGPPAGRLAAPALASLAALGVLVAATRLDRRLARSARYRVPRHAARLLLVGAVAGLAVVAWEPAQPLGSARDVLRALGSAEAVGPALIAMAIAHLLLRRGIAPRGGWRTWLSGVRARNR